MQQHLLSGLPNTHEIANFAKFGGMGALVAFILCPLEDGNIQRLTVLIAVIMDNNRLLPGTKIRPNVQCCSTCGYI